MRIDPWLPLKKGLVGGTTATELKPVAPKPLGPTLARGEKEQILRLPANLVAGLRLLRDQPPPKLTQPEVWPGIVWDAITLAAGGWIERAVKLGWHPLELLGCSPAPEGDERLLGLAGRLEGRRMRAITSAGATFDDGEVRRTLMRRSWEGAIYLWEYGR